MLIWYENAGIKLAWHNLKEVGLSFLFTPKSFHGAEIWGECKQLRPSSADHRLDGGRALRSTLVIDVFDRLFLGIFSFRLYWIAIMRYLILPPSSGHCGLVPWGRHTAVRDNVVPSFEVSPPFTSPSSKLHLFSCLEDGSNHTYLCIFNTYAQFLEYFWMLTYSKPIF